MQDDFIRYTAGAVGGGKFDIGVHGVGDIKIYSVVSDFELRRCQAVHIGGISLAPVGGRIVRGPVKVFELDMERAAFGDFAVASGTYNVRGERNDIAEFDVDGIRGGPSGSIDGDDLNGVDRVVCIGRAPRSRSAARKQKCCG